jgi:hypothetical protein
MLVLEVSEGILAVVRGMQGENIVKKVEMNVFTLILIRLKGRMKLYALCMCYATVAWT